MKEEVKKILENCTRRYTEQYGGHTVMFADLDYDNAAQQIDDLYGEKMRELTDGFEHILLNPALLSKSTTLMGRKLIKIVDLIADFKEKYESTETEED